MFSDSDIRAAGKACNRYRHKWGRETGDLYLPALKASDRRDRHNLTMSDRLRVFVASSSEQLAAAEKVATALQSADGVEGNMPLEVCPWQKGVFEFSAAYIESLEQELDRADFAVVILTGHDTGTVRDETVNLPRDNVIFELGLFIGRLGRKRCFFFIDGDSDTKVASDLSGVEPVKFFDSVSRGPGRPSLEQQALKVRNQIVATGPRYKPAREIRAGQQKLWLFNRRLAGSWWERMRKGDDEGSALSFVTITIDELTNTPRLEARSFGLDGEYLAEWSTVVTGLDLSGPKPVLYYRWEGEFDEAIGQKWGGGGTVTFDDLSLNSGAGYFYDTNFALLKHDAKTVMKRFGFYRCVPADVEVMIEDWTEEARSLRISRLKQLRGR